MTKYCKKCGINIADCHEYCIRCRNLTSNENWKREKIQKSVAFNGLETRQKRKAEKRLITVMLLLFIIAVFLIIDVDGDGLNNLSEIQIGTAFINSDTDSDGLKDGREVKFYGTDPLDADTDGDNINDGSEVNKYRTDPCDSDSDNDNLDDYEEIFTYDTNPLDADYDNDGLEDGEEVYLGTNLFDSDTDGDGYKDGLDPHPTEHEWKFMDSDNDGWSDYKEYYEKNTDRYDSDTDGDGYIDSTDPHPTEHEWKFQDSDDDGWTDYKEYFEIGTSRYNSDTDGDGAPDPQDAHPLNAAIMISRYYEWYYPDDWLNKVKWGWPLDLPYDLYKYEKELPRLESHYEWSEYILDPIVAGLADRLEDAANDKGFDYYETVNFVLVFIHTLNYIPDVGEYPKYPLETLVDEGGDCEDTSFLFAGILNEMGYDVCLIILSEHVAVGVWGNENYPGTYYTYNSKRYYYCETTEHGGNMGELPDEHKGEKATIIHID